MADNLDVELEMARAKAAALKLRQAAAPVEIPEAQGWRTEADIPGLDPRTTLGAAQRGVTKGATLSWGDEIRGGLAALGRKLGLSDASYEDEVGAARAEDRAASDAHPYVFGGAELVGGLAMPLPGAGAAKGATTLQRMGQFAKVGAPVGVVAGAGASEDDVAGDALAGGVVGGAVGAALPPVLKGAGFLAGTAAKGLRMGAESLAVKSITPTAGLVNRLRKLGYDTPEKVRAFGRRLLDAGIIPAGGTPETALERAMLEINDSGADIGMWLAKADELVQSGATPPASRSTARVAAYNGAAARLAPDSATGSDAATAQLGKEFPGMTDYMGTGTPDAPLSDATTFRNLWNNKSALQQTFRKADTTPLQQEVRNSVVDEYARNVYQQLEGAVGPEGKDVVKMAGQRYGAAKDARNLLQEATSRNAAKGTVGLMDTQLGQVAGSTGIPFAGPIVTAASAALRSRAPSAMARGLDALAGPAGRFGASGPAMDYSRPLRTVSDYMGGKDKRRNMSPADEVATSAFLSGG